MYPHLFCLLLAYVSVANTNETAICERNGVSQSFNYHLGSLHGSTFSRLLVPSLSHCARACTLRTLCRSINYEFNDRRCSLNAASLGCVSPGTLLQEEGTIHIERQSIPDKLAGVCENHTCGIGRYCLSFEGSQFECAEDSLLPGFAGALTSSTNSITCSTHNNGDKMVELICSSFAENESFEHCPVLKFENEPDVVCRSNARVSCSPEDCITKGMSVEYTGKRRCTISGRVCQRWDQMHPHSHAYRGDELFPEKDASLASNYCRDPSHEGQLWCYTTDPGLRWEYCGVPYCPWADEPECGVVSPKNKYSINSNSPFSCAEPYNNCSPSGEYIGNMACTVESYECQKWTRSYPHNHPYHSAIYFPDVSVESAENYCRSVLEPDVPICYTMNNDKEWDYCAVPSCLPVP